MSSSVDKTVAGNDDSWILFERSTSEGYPLIVLARIENELVDASIRNAPITIVECQAETSLVNERMMPQHSDRIYPIEEELALRLGGLGAEALHVASVTGDGRRRIVVTHAKPIDFDAILTIFQVEGYSLRAVPVADRDNLLELIVPNEVDRQLNGDRGVISNLEQHGDNGLVPRKTDFWFYGEQAALTKVFEELEPRGYVVDRWLDDPEGLVLTNELPADFETFREITPTMIDVAARYGVTYDGWETFVVSLENPTPGSADPGAPPLFQGWKN